MKQGYCDSQYKPSGREIAHYGLVKQNKAVLLKHLLSLAKTAMPMRDFLLIEALLNEKMEERIEEAREEGMAYGLQCAHRYLLEKAGELFAAGRDEEAAEARYAARSLAKEYEGYIK